MDKKSYNVLRKNGTSAHQFVRKNLISNLTLFVAKIIYVRCQLGYISLHFIEQRCLCYICFVCADKSHKKTKLVSQSAPSQLEATKDINL